MSGSTLAEMDRQFAEIAVSKGYVEPSDIVTALSRRLHAKDGCYPGSLPSVLIEENLITCEEIDAVLDEMFDSQ